MIDREYDDDYMRIVVTERAKTIKVLLSSRVPQSQADQLARLRWVVYYLD